jgi:cell wall-associated NlpC family hydrolase
MAFVTFGVWVPFEPDTTTHDDDEEFAVPPPLFEGHNPFMMPAPRPAPVVLHKAPKPELHNPADRTPQRQHKVPPKTIKIKPVKPVPVHTSGIAAMVAFLRAQLGDRYVLGGNGPDVWDCSGLTKAAYARVGVTLPRTSEDQSIRGSYVNLSRLEVGDLLFWGAGPGLAYHVAIYIGGGRYIAAQNPSVGVVERTLTYSPPDFARRIL